MPSLGRELINSRNGFETELLMRIVYGHIQPAKINLDRSSIFNNCGDGCNVAIADVPLQSLGEFIGAHYELAVQMQRRLEPALFADEFHNNASTRCGISRTCCTSHLSSSSACNARASCLSIQGSSSSFSSSAAL